MDPIKRLQRLSKKSKISDLNHVHIVNGVAYATDGIRLYSTPTDQPDCVDCDFRGNLLDVIADNTRDLRALAAVSTAHLKKAVKMAATMHSGRTAQDKRSSSGQRWVTLSVNGQLDVSAETEYGRTCVTLENGDTWNEKWLKSKAAYKCSEVVYQHAGDNIEAHFDADKLNDALMLAADEKADTVELEFWQSVEMGVTLSAGNSQAVLCGALDPKREDS